MSVYADVLPEEIPENQIWTTTSLIEGVGFATESTSLNWHTSDAGLDALPRPVYDGRGMSSGSIAYAIYKDSIKSNGGQISEVKSFSLDTHAKTEGLYNIETEKIMTYTSQNGSHLLGEEYYLLGVIGNWSLGISDLVCVFSRSERDIIPAFCNKVTASSKFRSITTAQIESIGSIAVIGSSPAALAYAISVVPDSNSASGFADGIISTTFTVSVMEGRSDNVQEIDPFARGGWGRTTSLSGEGWRWGDGSTSLIFIRDTSDFIRVDYNGNFYSAGGSGSTLSGTVVPTLGNLGITPLPPEAQLTIDAGDGGRNTPYIVTFEGAEYRIGPGYDPLNPPFMIRPAIHLENYDELAARLTTVDTATVSGGISTFVKGFNYQSGINCEGC